MSGPRKRRGDRGRRLAGLTAAAGLVALGGWYGLSAGRPAAPAAATASAPAPVASAGQIIYRDPATGRLAVPPPDVAAQIAPRAVQRPAVPTERLGITPRGGVAIDHPPLMAVTSTVGSDGHVSTRCDPAAADGRE